MRIYFIVLLLFVSGCDNATETKKLTSDEQAELKQFINKIKSELVYVKGGTFWMGDFCKKMRNGGPYCSSEKDTKPLHQVELTSYSVSKFKVTHEEYNYYLTISGLPKQSFNKEWRNEMLADMTFLNRSPAIVTWTEANYSRSPVRNPQGPTKPVIKDDDSGQYLKVLRGGNNPDPSGDVGLTFFRGYRIKDNPYPASTTVRCVVNSPDPIK